MYAAPQWGEGAWDQQGAGAWRPAPGAYGAAPSASQAWAAWGQLDRALDGYLGGHASAPGLEHGKRPTVAAAPAVDGAVHVSASWDGGLQVSAERWATEASGYAQAAQVQAARLGLAAGGARRPARDRSKPDGPRAGVFHSTTAATVAVVAVLIARAAKRFASSLRSATSRRRSGTCRPPCSAWRSARRSSAPPRGVGTPPRGGGPRTRPVARREPESRRGLPGRPLRRAGSLADGSRRGCGC